MRRILFTPGQRDKLLRQCKGTYKPLPELERLLEKEKGTVIDINGDIVSGVDVETLLREAGLT